MNKNSFILIHMYNDSILHVKSKTDLSRLLGVSLSTIMRRFTGNKRIEINPFIIYFNIETYENGIELNYSRDINSHEMLSKRKHLSAKVSRMNKNSIESGQHTDSEQALIDACSQSNDNVVKMNKNERVSIHDLDMSIVSANSVRQENTPNVVNMTINDEDFIQDEEEEKDWRKVEDNLSITEYDTYYSKRTYEQLSQSKLRYDNVRGQSPRLKIINKYGELKAND